MSLSSVSADAQTFTGHHPHNTRYSKKKDILECSTSVERMLMRTGLEPAPLS